MRVHATYRHPKNAESPRNKRLDLGLHCAIQSIANLSVYCYWENQNFWTSENIYWRYTRHI